MSISGTKYYKAFDKDLKCRGMQYEVGKEYAFDDEPILCRHGFHFCKSIVDCYGYYDKSEDTRICEVLPLGEVKTDGTKCCTNRIKILEEVENPRSKSNASASSSGYCNTGDWNSGNYNSGNWNSGDRNSGDGNTGNYNSGYYNTGGFNSGHNNTGTYNFGSYNTGNRNIGVGNTGAWNSGDWNAGTHNSGNGNSGNWNAGNCSSGFFNTEKNPKIKMFDQESDWTFDDWYFSKACHIMSMYPQTYFRFIRGIIMTDEEKEKHPEYKELGGYMKKVVVTKADKQEWWDKLSEGEKEEIYSLPNFDAEKFELCTEIKVKFPGIKQKRMNYVSLDKLDEIITDALDKSTDQKESQTLRWVLDKISEVKK